MLDTVQIAVLSTLACFALVFVAYVKSVLGKAAQEQQQVQKEADSRKSSVVDGGNEDDNSSKGSKARKVSSGVKAEAVKLLQENVTLGRLSTNEASYLHVLEFRLQSLKHLS